MPDGVARGYPVTFAGSTSALTQACVTTVVTTSVTEGVFGVEENPNRQGGSMSANAPRC